MNNKPKNKSRKKQENVETSNNIFIAGLHGTARLYKESKDVAAVILALASLLFAFYSNYNGLRQENDSLRKQLAAVRLEYDKKIYDINFMHAKEKTQIHDSHVREIREEDRKHDVEVRQIYKELNKMMNKLDRYKVERDLFAFAAGNDKTRKNYDPIAELTRLRKKNTDDIRKAIDLHKEEREHQRTAKRELEQTLDEIKSLETTEDNCAGDMSAFRSKAFFMKKH